MYYKLSASEVKAHQFALQTLVDMHLYILAKSNKPGDTAALLVDRLGLEGAAEAVSLAIILRGKQDGRLSARNHQWADEVLPLGREFYCEHGGLIYPHEVHPAQLNQIADAMRELTAKN